MNKDIQSIEDVKNLVDSFYQKALKDQIIGHFFTQVIQLDMTEHMPVMYQFWESILLGGRSYTGNPMTKHLSLNKKSPMKKEHFDQWIFLWKETVDELFAGETANQAKFRAEQIAKLMEFKLLNS